MKAYELAKKIYPSLSKQDFIEQTCPDVLQITDKINCDKYKTVVDDKCVKCWEQEVSDERAEWLLEANRMCKYLCG
ncbi:MAG: hypothetical protein PHT02_00070 [Tissierellia bacterium]|nr:hypothetical protein [Tissierellia bacterium]